MAITASTLLGLAFLPLTLIRKAFVSSGNEIIDSFFISSPSILFKALNLSSYLFNIFPLSSRTTMISFLNTFSPQFFKYFVASPILLPLSSVAWTLSPSCSATAILPSSSSSGPGSYTLSSDPPLNISLSMFFLLRPTGAITTVTARVEAVPVFLGVGYAP